VEPEGETPWPRPGRQVSGARTQQLGNGLKALWQATQDAVTDPSLATVHEMGDALQEISAAKAVIDETLAERDTPEGFGATQQPTAAGESWAERTMATVRRVLDDGERGIQSKQRDVMREFLQSQKNLAKQQAIDDRAETRIWQKRAEADIGEYKATVDEASHEVNETLESGQQMRSVESGVEPDGDPGALILRRVQAVGKDAAQPVVEAAQQAELIPQQVEWATPERPGLFPVADIQVRPDLFQFKATTSKSGHSGSLQDQRRYIPQVGGLLTVWRDDNGTIGTPGLTYVVNGHNRLDLARRANVETVNVFYINAATHQEAKAWGAIQNIADHNGTPIDAAKFLRSNNSHTDELREANELIGGTLMSTAKPLVRLPQHIFDATSRGEIPLAVAQALGTRAELPPKVISMVWEWAKKKSMGADKIRQAIILARADAPIISGDRRQQNLLSGTLLGGPFNTADISDMEKW